MKKILSTVAAAAVLATSSFAGQSPYLIAGLGMEMVDVGPVDLDMGFAMILGGGLPLNDIKVGPGTFAVEGELTYSIIAPSYNDFDMTFMTLGAYGAYIIDIDKQFFVKPRVGLIYKSFDADHGYSDSEIGLALGVQGGYKLNKQLDIIVGLNLVDGMDIMHITGGVQYHF